MPSPVFPTDTTESTPATAVEQMPLTDTWQNGLEGIQRQTSPGENSVLVSLLLVLTIALSLSFNHCRRIFKNLPTDLLLIKSRNNAFEDNTSNELRTFMLLVVMLAIGEGIIATAAACPSGFSSQPEQFIVNGAIVSAIFLGYYFFQYCAYSTVGYAFADPAATSQWLTGFRASQNLLALILLVPSILLLLYPAASTAVTIIGAIAYVSTRLLFICKGFRIFFDNLQSILYFILYLCALEIAPLIFIAKIVGAVTTGR